MKFNNQKIIIVIGLCFLILGSICILYRTALNKNEHPLLNISNTQPATLNTDNATDVFYGTFHSFVRENGTTKEPGQRFEFRIQQNPKYPQIGNAKGIVIVNDSTNKYDHNAVFYGASYLFYTKYDASNNWYTIVKGSVFPSVGDQ